MIRCNDFGKHIRLGNWLFVYAAIVDVAQKTGHSVEMPSDYFFWKYLKNPPALTSDKRYDLLFKAARPQFKEEDLADMRSFFKDNQDKVINFDLTCFLQSEKWFDPDLIKMALEFREDYKLGLINKYGLDKPSIGIGVRRGDFVGHSVFHQIPEDWYTRALLANFPNWKYNHNVFVFSDDIDWCKEYFKDYHFRYAEKNGTHVQGEPYHADCSEQFILGSMCDHFIGGSSTFSWWQMWLVNKVNGGTVVHCGRNISKEFEHLYGNTDYYPKSWKLYAE